MSDLLAIDKSVRRLWRGDRAARASRCRSPQGQALALLGRNGMGKTTLINTIVGVTRYRGGSIMLDGQDITNLRPDQRARRRHRLGAAGAQHLQIADGRGEPHRGRAARALGPRQDLRAVSAPEGAPPQSRQSVVRRRAADAGDRPRARPQPAHHAARRAARRAGADPGRGIAGGACAASSARKAFRRSWSSRTRRKSSASPTAPSSSSAVLSSTGPIARR